jgi:quinol monooxygenase YgiN
MIYLQATAKLRPGKREEFVSLLNTLLPVVGKHGFKLLGSYMNVVGRLNTIVDLWELPDANALKTLLSDPELQRYAPQFNEIIEDEQNVFLTKLPIG